MKLSPFMIQVKKWLKKRTKKELIEQVLMGIEQGAQQTLSEWDIYNDLQNDLQLVQSELIRTEWFLKSAESAIRYYENMSIIKFIQKKLHLD
jgi:hypothetical protein